MGKALAKRKDETERQFRGRLANARTQGESRDVINPHRLQHNEFERAFVVNHETGNKEAVQRRKSMIADLHSRMRINDSEAKALFQYRQAWDVCDRSPNRDSCDFSVKGTDGDGMAYLDARTRLNKLQAVTKAACKLDMFELIVCHDKSFKKTAEEIFGYANQSNIDIVERNFERGVVQVTQYLK